MISTGQTVTQETRRDERPRTTIDESSSSGTGSSSTSPSSSTITAHGNAPVSTSPTSANIRTDSQTHVANTQPSNMPSTRHITTHDPNSGIYTTRVEIRHDLPDLLHSHVVPSQQVPHVTRHGQPIRQPPPAHILNQRGQVHVRHHAPRHIRTQQHHRRRTRSRSHSNSENDSCNAGCLACLAASTSFRWILVILSLLGVCCVVTGIVLAALHAAGNSFLFLAIMFIGKF